jgi:hypothetical protein
MEPDLMLTKIPTNNQGQPDPALLERFAAIVRNTGHKNP